MGLQYRIINKKGCDNGVADALSRQVHQSFHLFVVFQTQLVWLQDIVNSYAHDVKTPDLLIKLVVCRSC